jgi:chromosomal replication initiation ATPase DnaA
MFWFFSRSVSEPMFGVPRQVAMYLARRHTKASLHEIGETFGDGIMERCYTLAELSLCA